MLSDSHLCVVHDVQPAPGAGLVKHGATGAAWLKEMVSKLGQPRTSWLTVPAEVADGAHGDLGVVEGWWPTLSSLAPGIDAALRISGRRAGASTAESGFFLRCGPQGSGHFVKMAHNGIDHGVMAAYAEGLNILRRANVGRHDRPEQARPGAETTPLRDPGLCRFEMYLPEIAELCWRARVIESWLLDLTATAPPKDRELVGMVAVCRIHEKAAGPSRRPSMQGCRCSAPRRSSVSRRAAMSTLQSGSCRPCSTGSAAMRRGQRDDIR
ncbi:hypothetical protein [Hydrogenophaga sp.]|uniref:hypothetical protein n=2 Tax=Hydrogenophaga sp. TaxID=1904254 RepID=UPI00341DFF7D